MLALAHPAASCSATTQANLTGPPPFFEWPTFVRWSDLEGSAWYEYFSAVYENDRIPNGHFPLHVSSFWMLYTDQLHDVDVPSNPPRCPGSSRGEMARDGGYYTENNMYSPPNTAWIWHKPPYHAVESDASWIEVIHRKDPFGDEHFGAWFLSAKGSGVWLHAGKSISFDEHDDACASSRELPTHRRILREARSRLPLWLWMMGFARAPQTRISASATTTRR